MQKETKQCQNCKQDFTIEPQDFDFYEKIKVPPPTWCPECRMQRRMAWRNERFFFHNTCQKCGKKVISVYPEDSGVKVYCRPCWWSDDWDGMSYGIDFNPNKPFFEQIKELLYKIPLPDLFGLYATLENSEYTNMVADLKNCYYLTMADWNENCSYGSNVFHTKDSYDSLILDQSELCYETVNCRKCYKTIFSIDCESCDNVSFSRDCIGCSNCIGCVGLRNKKYHILNKSYSKEEYTKLAQQYNPNSRKRIQEIIAKVDALSLSYPKKFIHGRLNNSVSGDYIYNSKDVFDSFMVQDMENSRYCTLVLPGGTTDAYDHTHYGGNTELLYETLQVGNQASNIIGSWFVITGVQNVGYSIWSIGSKNIFGCVGLKKREYCILNKQYSKKDYEALKEKIIFQMNNMPHVDVKKREYRYGEFFPIEMSPFPYNFSGAQEVFPLSESQVKEHGYKWKKPEKPAHGVTISADKIPDLSENIPDNITKEILECSHKGECDHQCSSAFLITPQELEFYKRMQLPLPNLCPNCRHFERIKKKNPFKLWSRKCAKCNKGIKTSYAPDRPEIVYCESCYNKEVA